MKAYVKLVKDQKGKLQFISVFDESDNPLHIWGHPEYEYNPNLHDQPEINITVETDYLYALEEIVELLKQHLS